MAHRDTPRRARGAFTLIEVMIATALTLLLMAMVVTVFATVTDSISTNRAAVEMNDQIRAVKDLIQRDMAGITARMLPPQRPEDGKGYFEYIEGPIGPVFLAGETPLSMGSQSKFVGYDYTFPATDVPGFSSLLLRPEIGMPPEWLDGTHGDSDDVLMFTTQSVLTPFRGRFGGYQTTTSVVAEVAWFLRGTTLYRRVLLVAPAMEPRIPQADLTSMGFYLNYDLSARQISGEYDAYDPLGASGSPPPPRLALNSLGDLTKRENRYGHQPHRFPYDARFWGRLGLPTLRECTYCTNIASPNTAVWPFPLHFPADAGTTFSLAGTSAPFAAILPRSVDPSTFLTVTYPDNGTVDLSVDTARGDGFDAWENPHPWREVDRINGTLQAYFGAPGQTAGSTRLSEDIVLNNVLSFDVKAWDPGAPVLERQMGNGSVVAILPGDPGYIDQLRLFAGGAAEVRVARFGAYVDLNYLCRLGPGVQKTTPYGTELAPNYQPAGFPESVFCGPGLFRSGQGGTLPSAAPDWDEIRASVFDTWSTHYESDAQDNDGDGVADEGTDGLDNDIATGATQQAQNVATSTGLGVNGVDDLTEMEAPPPYPVPLRGIQIKLRVFEPSTRQIREVTIVQEFSAQ